MKNKKVFVLGLLILALIFAVGVTACGGNNGNDNNDGNGNGNGQGNGGKRGVSCGEPSCNKEHFETTDCDGGCIGTFIRARREVTDGTSIAGGSIQDAIAAGDEFDNNKWRSWRNRGGNYHATTAFSARVGSKTVYFGLDTNGDGRLDKAPCFKYEVGYSN
jgi:hypothetical protein